LSKKLKAQKNVFHFNDIKAHSFEIHYEIVATMKKEKKQFFIINFLFLCLSLSLLADCATRNYFSAVWMPSKSYEDVEPKKSLKLNFSFSVREDFKCLMKVSAQNQRQMPT
jgi:hypothetical protein